MCNKQLKPIDINSFNKEDFIKINSMDNQNEYYTTIDDYEYLLLSISKAFGLLCKLYDKKESFRFESYSFSIQKIM